MKRVFAGILALILFLMLAGCMGKNEEENDIGNIIENITEKVNAGDGAENVDRTDINEGESEKDRPDIDKYKSPGRLELSGSEKKLAGVYEGEYNTYIFAKDGTLREIGEALFSSNIIIDIGSYSADKETIEMVLGGSARKVEYTLNNDTLILYETIGTSGNVYTRTADGPKTAALKENRAEKLSGVFESWNKQYSFSEDGTIIYSEWASSKHGHYSIDGNTLFITYDDGSSDQLVFEMDDDLVIFEDEKTRGVVFSNVTSEYEASEKQYAAALSAFNAGRYEEAASLFESVPDYLDSNEMANKAHYSYGLQLYNSEQYEAASEVFSSLGYYEDSYDLQQQCKRQIELAATHKEAAGNANTGNSLPTIGGTVIFGSYEQDNNLSNGKEDIEWIVLDVQGNRCLLISKYALDCQQYNASKANVTWETCTLRKWLNSTFLSTAFTDGERAMIPSVMVSADKNPSYSTSPGNSTTDQVFLLSVPEATYYFRTDEARKCLPTLYAVAQGAWISDENDIGGRPTCWWLLRSPGEDSRSVAGVSSGGTIGSSDYKATNEVESNDVSVRPALWISL